MKKTLPLASILLAMTLSVAAQTSQPIAFGDFENWVTRNIHESGIIGGKTKVLYEVGPQSTVDGNKPYTNQGGSPWATSNVYAHVKGINKGSASVFPDTNPAGGKCCKLTTLLENVKVLGLINMDVLVSGSIYLGYNIEPITSTSNPYGKMEMGIPFTKRPRTLRLDYRMLVPEGEKIRATGFSKKKIGGKDKAEVYILLQRRWEDAEGNIYAKRVGTGRERFGTTTNGWIRHHDIPVIYGDATKDAGYQPYMNLISKENSYYAKNSKGKMVPVVETGWDDANAIPTHMLVMASSGCGTAYEGTPGMTLWIDNITLTY